MAKMEQCVFDKLYSKLQKLKESKTNSAISLSRFIKKYLKKNTKISLAQNLIILDQFEYHISQSNSKFKYAKLVEYFIKELQRKKNKKIYNKKNYEEHITFNLNVLMLYSVNKSFKQYKIFQLNYDDYQIVNSEMFNDEISIIELMNEYRVTLTELIKKFRRIFFKYSLKSSPKKFPFYEYITWLLRIYSDTTFEIKNKIDRLDDSEYVSACKVNSTACKIIFRLQSLFHKTQISSLLNTLIFQSTDFITYYIWDLILQLENLNEKNLKFLIPCLEKLVSIESNRKYFSKSKYLRLVLVYSKLRIIAPSSKIFKFDFLKQSTDLCRLKIESKNSSLDPNEKLRNCLLFDLDKNQNNEIFFVLHTRSLRKFHQVFELITLDFNHSNDSTQVSKISQIFSQHEHTEAIQVVENGPKERELVREKDPESKESRESESEIEKDKLPNENDLIFTSDCSLFDYKTNDNSDDELFRPINSNLKSIQKTKNTISDYHEISNQEIFVDLTLTSASTPNIFSFYPKKNDLILERSPSPSNISRLNLFKKIFDDDKQSKMFNNFDKEMETFTEAKSEKCKSAINPVNKFYKLNDLVSIMLNEDYFKKQ